MEIGLARMNKDGSVTIPYGMRRFFKQGEPLIILADEKRVTLKRSSDVARNLLSMAQEPSAAGGVRRTARPPVKVPKRDKFGHFLPAKKPSQRK